MALPVALSSRQSIINPNTAGVMLDRSGARRGKLYRCVGGRRQTSSSWRGSDSGDHEREQTKQWRRHQQHREAAA